MSESQINSLGFTADVDDQASGPAQAAADALKNLGAQADAASAGLDSVDQAGTAASSTVTTRLLPSMTQLNRVLDDNAAMNAKGAAVEAQRTRYLDALAASTQSASDAGLTYEQAQAKINDRFDAQIAKITSAASATKAHTETVATNTAAVEAAADAGERHSGILSKVADAFGVQTYQVVQATDELHKFADQVLAGGSAITAGFYQLPNMTAALGGFGNMAKTVGGFLIGPGGIAVAAATAVGALAALGVAAEHQQEQFAALGVQMQATRTDASAMAAEVAAAARAASGTGTGLSMTDATSAGKVIGSTYNFSGTTEDLTDLIGVAQRLALVMGETVPDAAKTLSEALTQPGTVAEELAKAHFPGMSQALADSIERMQAAGQQGQAFAAVMQVIEKNTSTAREDGLTPFQRALEQLTEEFKPPADNAKALGRSFGDDIVSGATQAITALDTLVSSVKNLGNSFPGLVSVFEDTFMNTLAPGMREVVQLLGYFNSHNTSSTPAAAPIPTPADGGYPKLLTNSTSGAMGIMQVMPGMQQAFAAQGIDITTTAGNVQAGLQVLSDGLSKYGGNLQQALGYYGGFSDVNSTGAKAYASSVMSKDEANLPSDTARLIYDQSQSAGLGAYSTVAQRIALQESGGRQFAGSTYSLSNPVDTTLPSSADSTSRLAGMVSSTASLSTVGTQAASGYSSWSDQAAQIQANITAMTAYRATLDPTSAAYAKLSDQINDATGKLRDAKSGQDLITQSMKDGEAPLLMMTGYQRTMAEVAQQFTDEANKQSGGVVNLTAEHAALTIKQQELAAAYAAGTTQVQQQTAVQTSLISTYEGGTAAVQHATDYQQAYTAAGEDFDKTTPAFTAAVKARTDALDQQANVAQEAKLAQSNGEQQVNLQYIQAETSSLGMNSQARAVYLAQLQASVAAHRDENGQLGPEAQKSIELAGAVASATNAYQQQQQALSDLSSGLSGVFSTLGDDISQAFTQGSGSAVTFKSVLSALETQVASLAVKFAVINPIMNSLFGQSNTTLGGIATALSGTGSVASANQSGIGGGFSSLGSLSSIGNLFSGSGLSGIGSSVGTGLSNIWSGLTGGTSSTMSLSVTPGLGVSGISESAASGLWNGGSALSGFGGLGSTLGIAGSVLPGLLSGNYAQAASGGIGAAIGTAILPGIGTVLGGLGGNLLGGLFGGHKKNPYTIDTVGVSDGSLNLASSYNQAETDQYTAQLTSDISALNATFKSLGLSAAATTGKSTLGLVGDGAGNVVGSIASMLNGIALTGSSSTVNQALNGSSFSTSDYASVSSFQTAITALKTMADTVDTLGVKVSAFNADAATVTVRDATGSSTGDLRTALSTLNGQTLSTSALSSQIASINAFVGTTMPQLLQATTTAESSYQTSIDGLNSTYAAAVTQASALGLSTDALSAKLVSLKASMEAAARTSLSYTVQGFEARDLTATGQDEASALLSQHISAEQERTAFDQSWEDIYGSAYQQAEGYGFALAVLTKTQADERLAIQQKYADDETTAANTAAAAAATAAAASATAQKSALTSTQSLLSSIATYADTLNTGSASGLSVQDQYANAKSIYEKDAAGADAGDTTAASALVSAAQTFLSLSSTLNAGGLAYTNDVASVRAGLAGVADASDAITASFVSAQTSDVTSSIDSLKAEVVKLQQIVRNAALVGAAA